MSVRSTFNRAAGSLQPAYVRTPLVGAEPVFRFSVPVLRVRDVAVTVAWYRRHLGFTADPYPGQAPHEFAILERDGVQLLVRSAPEPARADDGHTGWDMYLWVDGMDLERLAAALPRAAVVQPLSAMGESMAELAVRDPDGYVLCIGGPVPAPVTQS